MFCQQDWVLGKQKMGSKEGQRMPGRTTEVEETFSASELNIRAVPKLKPVNINLTTHTQLTRRILDIRDVEKNFSASELNIIESRLNYFGYKTQTTKL